MLKNLSHTFRKVAFPTLLTAPLHKVVLPTLLTSQRFYSTKRIYLGNFPFGTPETEIQGLVSKYSPTNAFIPSDFNGTRGFSFFEMEEETAAKALEDLNGMEFNGRPLRVDYAQDSTGERRSGEAREFAPRRSGYGGDRGGRGGDRGGYRSNQGYGERRSSEGGYNRGGHEDR